ncbi:MAG: threonine dehydratase [Pseudomonadota bacterium]
MTRDDLEAAAALIRPTVPPTPQYEWPLLSEAVGARVIVKHENHTPTGAFKVRGSLTFMDHLTRTRPDVRGIVTATRGNHGQGQAMAATRNGLEAIIVVPEGNSREKNAAMRAFGATLIEHGEDFDTARLRADEIAVERNFAFVPPFHPALVTGVATYAAELFTARPEIDTVYVPIGCGSGICGLIGARDALGHRAEIVGVVADGADYAKRSFEAGRPLSTPRADTFADGMAVRDPVEAAFAIYGKGAARIVSVSDDAIAQAVRLFFATTHNVAEGAGAAPLAALMAEREHQAGKTSAVILCGGNIDTAVFAAVLAGKTPVSAVMEAGAWLRNGAINRRRSVAHLSTH